MIPKRAIFFWEGPEPSWLRQQSWESFKRLNPDWQVDVVDGSECPIPRNGDLSVVHRSDWTRYHELYERGGLYFDTDIAFIRPVPEKWLDADLLFPLTPEAGHVFSHVALLGSAPGTPFFQAATDLATATYENRQYLGYQSLGLRLLATIKNLLPGKNTTWVDHDAVLPIAWDNTAELWNDTSLPLPSMSIGVHWFGGDHLSRLLEPDIDPAWVADSKCLVAKALRKSGVCDA